MSRGIFISFEGPDGSGKSTQIKLLNEYCLSKSYKTIMTREPGGTPISEKIRSIILDPDNSEMCNEAEALLYAAARAQHVAQLIKPSVEKGFIVLSDRFMDSSIAYQGIGRGLGEAVRRINEYAVAGTQPDLTFFLDIDPEAGLRRAALSGKPDRLEQESLDFHRAVYEGYIRLSRIYKDRYVIIDASRSTDEVFEDIRKAFEAYVIKAAEQQ